MEDGCIGARPMDAVDLGRRDREPAALARVAEEPGRARAVVGLADALVRGKQIRGDRTAAFARASSSSASSASITTSFSTRAVRAVSASARRSLTRLSISPTSASRDSWRSISSSSRSSSVRLCFPRLSTSACMAWSSRGELTDPEYIVFSTSLIARGDGRALVVQPLHVTRHVVAPTAGVDELGFQRRDLGFGTGQDLPFGEHRPPVSQTLGGQVVALHREELLE